VPKQIDTPSESLPETTSTVLVSLYRLEFLRDDMVSSVQGYLWSAHYAFGKHRQGDAHANERREGTTAPEDACWSIGTRNVWITSLCLWVLVATRYRGPLEVL
jgi:hypothetical protein